MKKVILAAFFFTLFLPVMHLQAADGRLDLYVITDRKDTLRMAFHLKSKSDPSKSYDFVVGSEDNYKKSFSLPEGAYDVTSSIDGIKKGSWVETEYDSTTNLFSVQISPKERAYLSGIFGSTNYISFFSDLVQYPVESEEDEPLYGVIGNDKAMEVLNGVHEKLFSDQTQDPMRQGESSFSEDFLSDKSASQKEETPVKEKTGENTEEKKAFTPDETKSKDARFLQLPIVLGGAVILFLATFVVKKRKK